MNVERTMGKVGSFVKRSSWGSLVRFVEWKSNVFVFQSALAYLLWRQKLQKVHNYLFEEDKCSDLSWKTDIPVWPDLPKLRHLGKN